MSKDIYYLEFFSSISKDGGSFPCANWVLSEASASQRGFSVNQHMLLPYKQLHSEPVCIPIFGVQIMSFGFNTCLPFDAL